MGGCISSRVQNSNVDHRHTININMKEEKQTELQNYWHHNPNEVVKENTENINNVMKTLGI